MRDCLTRRGQGECMSRGAGSILRGALPVSRLPRVVRERFDDGIELVGVLARERGGDLAMERDTFARQELGVDGLARERVTKRESFRGLLDDQLCGDELFHESQELALVVVRKQAKQVEI